MPNMAPTICENCEKIFKGGPYAFFCPKCLKKKQSESAKKRRLSDMGRKAQKEEKEVEHAE